MRATRSEQANQTEQGVAEHLAKLQRFRDTRAGTRVICAPLSVEDHVPQSMPLASPAKWHLAHTTWFFERFVCREFVRGYVMFDAEFEFLFNSYYDSVGPRTPQAERGLLTRPSLERVFAYRAHVERAVETLLTHATPKEFAALAPVLEIGLQHEQQHQELLVTDIKHLLSLHPFGAAYHHEYPPLDHSDPGPLAWHEHPGGLVEAGRGSEEKGFAFDNEFPKHKVFLRPFALASRVATNKDFLKFISAGGYEQPEHWLSLGWAWRKETEAVGPLYWRPPLEGQGNRWMEFTLWGMRELDPHAPLCHVNFFEADAFARWSGARLPTEFEWEVFARQAKLAGNFGDPRAFTPQGTVTRKGDGPKGLFGDVWEWTSSSYDPYPGYKPMSGVLGEYNGKFMCNQKVLRGGSCATPRGHMRSSYRNFFPPEAQWQFSGIRLASDRPIDEPPMT